MGHSYKIIRQVPPDDRLPTLVFEGRACPTSGNITLWFTVSDLLIDLLMGSNVENESSYVNEVVILW